jgi:hypothetical protein
VKNTTFKDYADTDVGSGDAFLEMKMHILDMYDGVTVENITTFVLEQEYGDCIAIKEQPTLRKLSSQVIEKPPQFTSANTTKMVPGKLKYMELLLKLGLKDQFGNTISCLEHTIPMARLTLEKLTQFNTLSDFFTKSVGQSSK